ncbi:putative Tudor domain-containing protein [Seiridium cardinale]|uniref:Tudor domain-containing protein n=1 Tax=Seiridium cardinale TaxID=138064 RepID=A0ABR2XH43_9PEZI
MADVASIEEDIKQYREQLEVVDAGLREDPSNAELLALKSELDDALALLNETIAELKPAKAPPKSKASPPPTEPPKWSRENHPAFKKAAPPEEKEESGPVNYKVNDNVMAKWVSGDKGFYPARITSITGSSTAPIYIVKFKSYDNTEQLRAKDIRPVAQKRKADGTPTGSSTPVVAPSQPPPPPAAVAAPAPGVISSAASIDPELVAKNKEAVQKPDGDEKPKAKKIRATRELEAGKSKWQEFNSKKFSKAGKPKKDSMFRTPEGVHGRVGFTGSGQAMRKDAARSRHIYQANEDLD